MGNSLLILYSDFSFAQAVCRVMNHHLKIDNK